MDQSRQLEIGINTKGLLPLILVILTLSITLSISLSPIQENLDNHSIRPLEYSVRSKIREESGLHPKIKIYSFGDKTMSRLRRADLGLNDWASVIEAIAARKPKAIFIDKIFALPIGDDYYRPISKEEGSRFVERVRRTGIPVIVGSSFRSKSLSKRKYRTLPLYSLQAALREGTTKPSWLIENSKKTFFGPQEHIIDAFIPGSLENAGHGYAYPLTWLGGDKILPHGGILPFGEPLVGPDFIESHGTRIPVDTLGRIQPDLTNIQAFLSRTQRVISLMVRIARGQDETFVNEGDYVAILPHMYTGNTDKKESPIGIIAGGYIPVAIMNSVLSSRWIEEMPMPIIPILLVGFLSVLAGWTLKSRSFLFLSIMVILGFSSAGIASFSYFSYRLPWMESIFSFLLNGISIYSLRTLLTEQEAKKLKTALEGTFPPDRLAEILEDPSALVMRPREQELSIMFVDIVGFSVKAETMAADQIFEELKHQIKSITETIHRFGGVIDKTLGDGVMAFFGYDPTKDYEGNHARQAVLAAEAIQRHAFDFNRGVSDARNLLFLRIGINADKVYVGDVGDSRRFDFTLIGHGVNFAARLEPACTPFKIMISEAAKQLIDPDHYDDSCMNEINRYYTLCAVVCAL